MRPGNLRDTFKKILLSSYILSYLNYEDHIPIDIFLNELSFYRLEKEVLREFLMIEGILLEEERWELAVTLKEKVWNLFEHPERKDTNFTSIEP